MAAVPEQEIVDPFAFDIQLNTTALDLGFHSRNDGDQNQRPDIVDDICKGLHIQARIDRVIHGTEIDGGDPATLIVFGFRFHGVDQKRRLRNATIQILFRDLQKRSRMDPEVIGLWPNGDFTLSETLVNVQDTNGVELGGEAGAVGLAATLAFTLERQKGYVKVDKASITGSIFLDMDVRNYGPSNAVRITLTEDKTNTTGVVTDLRAAVLVKRQNPNDRFAAFVGISASGNFAYNTVKGMRNLVGRRPANDPVIFKPGLQYIRRPTLSLELEKRLAVEVDEENLGAIDLSMLGVAVGSTTIDGSSSATFLG